MPSLENFLTNAKFELNHIYTERPAFRNGGRDEGWFCREHAIHTFFLLRLFGEHTAKIETGHFTVRLPEAGITSHGSDADHAWCATHAIEPIDLSMTFKFHSGFPQLVKPVIGESINSSYAISYFRDESQFIRAMEGDSSAVLYLPQSEVKEPDALLDHPEHFLFDSGLGSWLQLYGADGFAQITLHAYKVAMSHTKSLTTLPPDKAFSHIRSRYSAARLHIRKHLAGAE